MDKFIRRYDTSAASRARATFERTRQRTSPYAAYPERETYIETEEYERADGSRYVRTRGVSRWGGEFACDPWKTQDITPV